MATRFLERRKTETRASAKVRLPGSPTEGTTVEDHSGRIVQTYLLADADSQAFVKRLLLGREGIAVATSQSGSDYLVAVDCDGEERAQWAFECVMTIDVDAVLLQTTSDSMAPTDPSGPHEFA
jgi:hypothetical protein